MTLPRVLRKIDTSSHVENFMKSHIFRLTRQAAAVAIGLLGTAVAQAVVINISAADATGATVALLAGADYTLAYAAPGTPGATYLAWNPWSDVSGCNGNGNNCIRGFSERFDLLGTSGDAYRFSASAGPYATEILANAAAVSGPILGSLNGGPYRNLGSSIHFHQANDIDALFYISDSVYSDNSGGVSLVLTRTDAIPEPQTYALMLVGLGLIGYGARRRALRLSSGSTAQRHKNPVDNHGTAATITVPIASASM